MSKVMRIEDDVAIPPRVRGKPPLASTRLAATMEVGQSLFVPDEPMGTGSSAAMAIRAWGDRQSPRVRFTLRREACGFRAWRIE